MAYITRDKADQTFSQFIRLRDSECVRCKSPVRLNEKGLPVSHTASHYFGRGKESVRFDPSNVDTLCYPCHVRWGSTEREEYRQYKQAQLGPEGYKLLELRAGTVKKKDRIMDYILAHALLKQELAKRKETSHPAAHL